MGGADKPSLDVGGITLLDRVLAACPDHVVIVGPERPTARPVTWCREDPAGSGPVAAVAAGLAHIRSELVVLLAGDLPFLTSEVVTSLLEAVQEDGALLVDDDGREQWLCSVWRTAALRGADLTSDRLGHLLGGLTAARLVIPVPAGKAAPWVDCDTPEDLLHARELV